MIQAFVLLGIVVLSASLVWLSGRSMLIKCRSCQKPITAANRVGDYIPECRKCWTSKSAVQRMTICKAWYISQKEIGTRGPLLARMEYEEEQARAVGQLNGRLYDGRLYDMPETAA